MEQRRLRLGDILDDYCPRERRVTNHAVVAMIEEDVKQTRCTTCDAEHAYKGGREPRRRKKDSSAALYREVLADMPEAPAPAPPPVAAEPPDAESPDAPPLMASPKDLPDDEPVDAEGPAVTADPVDEGPINRPLIRATLPRPEGQKDPRPLPEFTIRQKGGRNQFRGSHRQQGANGNGNRPQARRFHGGQPSGMPGRGAPGGGFRGDGQQRHGNRKRSR